MNKRETIKKFKCLDCKVSTLNINEYYMVENRIWNKVCGPEDGMLCVGCLEDRLGRQLQCKDFSKCPLNFDPVWTKSARLLNRITNGINRISCWYQPKST